MIDSSIVETTIESVRKHTTLLCLDMPFAIPLIGIRIHVTDKYKTAAIDGDNLFINPTWWNNLPKPEKLGLLLHEYLHVVLLHMFEHRIGSKNIKIWLHAIDFVVNSMIKAILASGKFSNIAIPKGGLFDPSYDGMSADSIYQDLAAIVNGEKPGGKKQSSGKGAGKKAYGDKNDSAKQIADGSGGFDFTEDVIFNDTLKGELIASILEAAEAHKNLKGDLPGGFDRVVDKLINGNVDWAQIFHTLVKAVVYGVTTRSYAKPKPWAWSYGFGLPGSSGKKLPKIVVIYDTSLSMNSHHLAKFNGELEQVLKYVSECTIITSDAAVHEVVKIKNFNDAMDRIKFKGGGGTNFIPALQEATKLFPDLVIYFTDGYGTFGTSMPNGCNKLLWVLTNNNVTPPFGRSLIIN